MTAAAPKLEPVNAFEDLAEAGPLPSYEDELLAEWHSLLDLLFPGASDDDRVVVEHEDRGRRVSLRWLRAEVRPGLKLVPSLGREEGWKHARAGAVLLQCDDPNGLREALWHPHLPAVARIWDNDHPNLRTWLIWPLQELEELWLVDTAGSLLEQRFENSDTRGPRGVAAMDHGNRFGALVVPEDHEFKLWVRSDRRYTTAELFQIENRQRAVRLQWHLDDRWAKAEADRQEQEADLDARPHDSWEELSEEHGSKVEPLGLYRREGEEAPVSEEPHSGGQRGDGQRKDHADGPAREGAEDA